MKRTRFAAYMLASILLASVAVPAEAGAAANDITILSQIAKIKAERKSGPKVAMAHALSDLVQKENPNAIRKDEIAGLTRLMDDKEDGVRMWAANCLGYIGPRANSAAPALRRAYLKIRCTHLDVSSRPMIEAALANIGAKMPVLAKCRS